MTKRTQVSPRQLVGSNESEPLVLDKESLRDLDPSVDQQLVVKTGRATVRDCL